MIAELVQHVVNGLIIGGGYALMGIGLTLIFGIMRVVNFAHGELYMLGAFFLFSLFGSPRLNFFVASAARRAWGGRGRAPSSSALDPAPAARSAHRDPDARHGGAVRHHPERRHPDLGPVAEDDPARRSRPCPSRSARSTWWRSASSRASMAVALIVGSHLFIQKTRIGRAMRATFQDTDMARLTGVDVDRVYMVTFAFGAALAGASGVLLGAVFWVYPAMGDLAALKSFAVVIMGGLGDFLGAIVGRPAARRGREPRRGLHLLGLQGRHRLRPDHHPAAVAARRGCFGRKSPPR